MNHPENADATVIALGDRAGPHRRVYAEYTEEGERVFVKEGCAMTPPRRLREAVKGALGISGSQREARALAALSELGLPVPCVVLEKAAGLGQRRLVMSFLEGHSLDADLEKAATRRRRMSEVGERLYAVHKVGWIHGDLHEGNILITATGPVLIDWARASKPAGERARWIDIARFERALWLHDVPLSDRFRFRCAALGVEHGQRRTSADRQALRNVGREVPLLIRALHEARTRRLRRPVDGRARVDCNTGTGQRVSGISNQEIDIAISSHTRLIAATPHPVTEPIGRAVLAHGECVLKHDHRAAITAVSTGRRLVVVKQVRKGGWRRRLADSFRGSPARRGFEGGHALALRRIGVAMPLAFVEARGWFSPRASWLLLEDVRADAPASELNHAEKPDGTGRAERTMSADEVDAIVRLLIRLHRLGIRHGDLQAGHIHLRRSSAGTEAILIDLESVRVDPRLDAAARIHDLASLNASFGAAVVSTDERCRALDAYLEACPMSASTEEVRARIVRASLARGHAGSERDDRADAPPSTDQGAS